MCAAPSRAVRALLPLLEDSTLPGGGVVVNISSIAAAHRDGQQCHVLRVEGGARQHDPVAGPRAGAARARHVGVAGSGRYRIRQVAGSAWRDEQAARTPLGRLATPEEVAAAVAAVITTLTFTTGTILSVDGGRTLG